MSTTTATRGAIYTACVPCRKCGSRERYVSSDMCQPCHQARNKRRNRGSPAAREAAAAKAAANAAVKAAKIEAALRRLATKAERDRSERAEIARNLEAARWLRGWNPGHTQEHLFAVLDICQEPNWQEQARRIVPCGRIEQRRRA